MQVPTRTQQNQGPNRVGPPLDVYEPVGFRETSAQTKGWSYDDSFVLGGLVVSRHVVKLASIVVPREQGAFLEVKQPDPARACGAAVSLQLYRGSGCGQASREKWGGGAVSGGCDRELSGAPLRNPDLVNTTRSAAQQGYGGGGIRGGTVWGQVELER